MCVGGILEWAKTMWTSEAFKAEGYIRRPRTTVSLLVWGEAGRAHLFFVVHSPITSWDRTAAVGEEGRCECDIGKTVVRMPGRPNSVTIH